MRTLILTKAAARILNLSEKSVRDLANRGALPVAERAGTTRLFRREDVERVAADRAQRQHSGSTSGAGVE